MLLSEVVIEKLLFLAFQLRPGSPFILMPPSCPWLMFLEAFKVKSLLFLWFFPPLWGRGESFSSWTFKAPFPLFRQAEMAVQGCLCGVWQSCGAWEDAQPLTPVVFPAIWWGCFRLPCLMGKGLYFRQLTPCLLPKTLLLCKTGAIQGSNRIAQGRVSTCKWHLTSWNLVGSHSAF